MQRALPAFRCARTAVPSATRRYATAPSSSAGSSAPYWLGAGVVGAGVFYWSTLSGKDKAAIKQEVKNAEKKAESAVGLTAGALDPNKFINFKLAEIIPYNHNTSRFVFELPEGQSSGLNVASAVIVKAAEEGKLLDDKGKPVIRPYTPTTAPGATGKMEFLVKKYPSGNMSKHFHELKVGDELAIKGPIPKFPWKANQFEKVALIAGGSGITPMWQVLQEIDNNPDDKTKATLIFSNVTEADILLRKEFDDLVKRKPQQFNVQYVLDKPPSGWKGPTGYITQKLLAQNLPMPAEGDKIKVFVCGPPPQMEAISGNKKSPKDQGELKGLLADMGYADSQVYKF